MQPIKSLFLLPLLVVLFLSCQTPRAGFFTTNVYLRPYEVQLDHPITFILDEGITEEFTTGRLDVKQFRKSLRLSLYYTFENSAPEITFADSIAAEGITVHLFRVRPDWEVVDSRTDVIVGSEVGIAFSDYEVASIVRYDGIVYKSGKRWFPLDQIVRSEQTTFQRGELPEVFRDGIRELCEDIYRIVADESSQSS